MDTIEVTIVNWNKYNPKRDQQSYSWLRLNNDFYLSPDLFGLSCEHKMIWIVLLCQASKANKATISVNSLYIAHQLGIKEAAVLQAIDIFGARQLATAGDRARPQTTPTNETYVRTNDTYLSTKADERVGSFVKALGSEWNEKIMHCPKFRGWPKSRDAAAKRFMTQYTLENWLEILKKINESSFLSGRDTKWRAGIDWALNPANAAKILEGNYENREGGTDATISKNSSDGEARRVLEGIKKFSPHQSQELQAFLGDELFRRVCKLPGGFAGIRSAPANGFTIKNLTSQLRDVTP